MGPDALIKQKIKQTRFRCGVGLGGRVGGLLDQGGAIGLG